MRGRAMVFLERWLEEARDPDLEQRSWKQAHTEGGLLAYERLGVLSHQEASRWRERFANPCDDDIDPGSALGAEARAAAEEYLTELVGGVKPLRRDPDPAAMHINAQCDAAIRALHEVGALDDEASSRWQVELLRAQAPWLEEPVAPPDNVGVFAVWVPPENEREAAEDAARAAEWEARPEASRVVRVMTGSPERHDELAIVALVVHEDAISLHFHYIGEPWQLDQAADDPLGFHDTLESLVPPLLRDGSGRSYEPVGQSPGSASGAGGTRDPARRQAITGAWLYTPTAPTNARSFTAERDGHSWQLQEHGR